VQVGRISKLFKVALIGHSASGKTSTLEALGIDPIRGDMDHAVGIYASPDVEDALDWMVHPETPQVLAVSNFIELMWHLQSAKRKGRYQDHFARVFWVYLRKSRRRLVPHLARGKLDNHPNPESVKQTVIQEYGRFSKHFNVLADHIIECDRITIAETADEIRRIVRSITGGAVSAFPASRAPD
jgi:hypothetical protein